MHGDGEKQLIEMLLKTRIIISCCFISLLAFFEEDCYASRPGSKECVKVSSASFTVRGRVIDTYGEPLIGATIREKGGANGTVTDVEGNFFLSVPDSAVLQISFVGYESQEVSVKGRSMLEICLKENILLLDHVIVTALGLEKKAEKKETARQKKQKAKIKDGAHRVDTPPLRNADKVKKEKVLLSASVKDFCIIYRRIKSVNELVVNGKVYDEKKAVIEFSHNLFASIDGHIVEAGLDSDSFISYIRFDGQTIAEKKRLL